jgi:hypothetical protein
MDNVYIITREDPNDRSSQVVGCYPAEGLAELVRNRLTFVLPEAEYDSGIFYRITAYEMGKLYPVDTFTKDAII